MSLNTRHGSTKSTQQHGNIKIGHGARGQQRHHRGEHSTKGEAQSCTIRQRAAKVICCHRRHRCASAILIRYHYGPFKSKAIRQVTRERHLETPGAADLDVHASLIPCLLEIPGASRRINLQVTRYARLGLTQSITSRRQFHQKIDICFVHRAPFSKASVQRNFLHRLHDFEKVYHPEADKSSVYAQCSTLTTCSTPWSTMSWALQVSSARLNYRAKHFHPAFTRSCEV